MVQGGEEGGEKMDIDTIVKFLGGENVRALLNNTELHEKIAEHINTYLPPGYKINPTFVLCEIITIYTEMYHQLT